MRNDSAPAGWSGSAAWRWRSAAFFWCATRSKRDSSAPASVFFSAPYWPLALVAAGEWARRKEDLSGLPGLPSANIPSILTAAGTTVAYATVYAAYALYGFLPPPVAFILLGIVALLTLAAALLHGPALAGLGVIGAYLAPALVATAKPDYWALYIYIAVVTAAAFALARGRMWLWLAIAAIVLSALWTFPGADVFPVAALGAHVFSALAGFVLAATFLVCGLLVWSGGGAGRSRSPLGIRARCLSSGRGVSDSGEPARSGRTHGVRDSHRRDRRHCVAHGSRQRAPCRSPPSSPWR